MKKSTLSLACTLLVTAALAQTQVIKANPLGYLLGTANLISYENAMDWPSNSYQVSLNHGKLSNSDAKYTILGIGLDGRAYFSKKTKAPRGLYLSVGGVYSKISIKIDDKDSEDIYASGAKLSFGYQWILDNGFALDLFGGYNYNFYKLETNQKSYNLYRNLPIAGIALGYAFGKEKE